MTFYKLLFWASGKIEIKNYCQTDWRICKLIIPRLWPIHFSEYGFWVLFWYGKVRHFQWHLYLFLCMKNELHTFRASLSFFCLWMISCPYCHTAVICICLLKFGLLRIEFIFMENIFSWIHQIYFVFIHTVLLLFIFPLCVYEWINEMQKDNGDQSWKRCVK